MFITDGSSLAFRRNYWSGFDVPLLAGVVELRPPPVPRMTAPSWCIGVYPPISGSGPLYSVVTPPDCALASLIPTTCHQAGASAAGRLLPPRR
jgi:hypothetical protein